MVQADRRGSQAVAVKVMGGGLSLFRGLVAVVVTMAGASRCRACRDRMTHASNRAAAWPAAVPWTTRASLAKRASGAGRWSKVFRARGTDPLRPLENIGRSQGAAACVDRNRERNWPAGMGVHGRHPNCKMPTQFALLAGLSMFTLAASPTTGLVVGV